MSAIDPVLGDLPPFPGKRPLASTGRHLPPAPERGDEDWDEEPKLLFVNGVQVEFFNIGAVARALGRKPVTIRSWEDKGVIPRSKYRTPAPKKDMVPGKIKRGRRLYTREQIQVLIDAARVTGVLAQQPGADWKRFTARVIDGWRRLS